MLLKIPVFIAGLLAYLSASNASTEDNSTISLPFEVEETLLDLLNKTDLDNLDVTNRSVVPLYRKDLDPDYIAYYEIDLNGEYYFILSAGPKTGDYKESQSGPPPLPTKFLKNQAKKAGQECEKYYMLCSMGIFMCENGDGIAVAATYNWTYDSPVTNWKKLQKMVEDLKDSKNFTNSWANVKNESKDDWKTSCQRQEKSEKTDTKKFNAKMVSPGTMVKVPLENYTKITVHANPAKKQKQLCNILKNVCSGKSDDVNKDLIQKSKCGIQFLEFQVKNDTGNANKGLPFYFEIENNDGQKLVVHFYVDVEGEVSKRSGDPLVNTREWAIDRADDLFPIYNQHMCPGSCYSGCVPVAWAMILAYYDRIAEDNIKSTVSAFGKKCWSKTDGDNGVAPLQMNDNVKKYVVKLRKILKTYCIDDGGATNPADIGKVKEFTDKRNIKSKIFENIDWRKKGSFLDLTAKFIKAKYPVQASILLSPTSGHAVVATKYREKTTTYKECRGRRCSTRTRKEKEVYLNMGWGGASNGWKKPDIYLVFALLKENANIT